MNGLGQSVQTFSLPFWVAAEPGGDQKNDKRKNGGFGQGIKPVGYGKIKLNLMNWSRPAT